MRYGEGLKTPATEGVSMSTLKNDRRSTRFPQEYAGLPASLIGLGMKEIMRRAMIEINRRRFSAVFTQKGLRPSGKPDYVSDADLAAQALYVELLCEAFPGFGIVGEEENYERPCTLPGHLRYYFDNDPIDGTDAFRRKQSHGIATHLSLREHNAETDKTRIIAAYVGNPLTGEMYGFRPGSTKAYRIVSLGAILDEGIRLTYDKDRALAKQYLLLRRPIHEYTEGARWIIERFESYYIANGSVGLSATALWHEEVGGLFLRPGRQTPWDKNVVIGISRKLGYSFWDVDAVTGRLTPSILNKPVSDSFPTSHEVLVVHISRIHELQDFR